MLELILLFIAVFGSMGFLMTIVMHMRTVPPNTAHVLYKERKGQRTLVHVFTSGTHFIWPYRYKLGKVDLAIATIDVEDPSIDTNELGNLTVRSVAQVQILPRAESLQKNALRWMDTPAEVRDDAAREVLQDVQYEFFETITQERLSKFDRDGFAREIQETASKRLKAVGIAVISVTFHKIDANNETCPACHRHVPYKHREKMQRWNLHTGSYEEKSETTGRRARAQPGQAVPSAPAPGMAQPLSQTGRSRKSQGYAQQQPAFGYGQPYLQPVYFQQPQQLVQFPQHPLVVPVQQQTPPRKMSRPPPRRKKGGE